MVKMQLLKDLAAYLTGAFFRFAGGIYHAVLFSVVFSDAFSLPFLPIGITGVFSAVCRLDFENMLSVCKIVRPVIGLSFWCRHMWSVARGK